MSSAASFAWLQALSARLHHPKNISGIWGFQYFLCHYFLKNHHRGTESTEKKTYG
jgi:hypothetical protein